MKKVSEKKRAKADCGRFGIAVMNLVMGEDIGMPQDELFGHLKVCKECRQELFEWRDTYTVMRMEADAKKPEYKQKAAEMADKIKKELICDVTKNGKKANRDEEIGVPAGTLWNVVAKEGMVRVTDIPDKMTNYALDQAYGAYGWLVLQNKIEIIYHQNDKCICLTPDERKKVQPRI